MQHMPRHLLSFLVASSIGSQAAAATFTIAHFGTPPDAQVAIQHAADIWGSILVSDVPIKVSVSWTALGTAALGVTFPNGRKDFLNAPESATWYATALANSIAGEELNPGEDDINVYLNSGTNWYLGLDGNTPAGQYDLVSIALHELGHGLGFVGLAKKVGNEGSLGLLLASDFAPLITTFPWPDQDTLPGIFDRFLTNTVSGELISLQNPGTILGTALTSNQVYFNGAYAMAANGGSSVRIYAPSVFALGSSCVHLNEATYPPGNPNELMTPFSSAGDASHWPGPIGLAIMRDIGWTLSPGVGVEEMSIDREITVFPNPVSSELTLRMDPRDPVQTISITDISGRVVLSVSGQHRLDVTALYAGTYVVMSLGARPVRFVKQ